MIQKGFTILEVLVVTSIFLIISLAGFGVFTSIQNVIAEIGLKEVEVVINSAANKARNGPNGTPWGFYFPCDEISRKTESAVIFSGNSYSTRETDKDINMKFSDSIQFVDVSVSGTDVSDGNDHEIIFDSFSGETSQYGEISVQAFNSTTTIVVSKHGFVTWR